MKPTDNLHQLVHSLTSSEKRYFKVHASRHVVGKQNKYEQLYDIYDSLPADHYDDAELKLKLKKKGLGKNLADDKKNLQEMIMKAMLAFHSGNSIDTQLNDLLAEEDFYRQKRLNDLRRKTIAKAKELAEKYEKYTTLLTLIDREINMKVEINQDELADLAENLDKEKSVVLDKLNTIAVLRNTNQWFFINFRLNANNLSEKFWKGAEEKLNNPIVRDYKPGLCFTADSNFFKVWSLYYQMKRDYINHDIYSKNIYELFETKYPLQKENDRLGYKIALYNKMTSLHQIKDYKAMGELLGIASAIKSRTEDEEGEDFQNIIFYRQIFYMNTGQFDKAIEMVPEIESGLKKFQKKVNKARELSICIKITIVYFITEDWGNVIKYSEKIITNGSEVRIDIKYNAMLYQLVSYFEINQLDLLSNYLRNTERLLKKHNLMEEETALIIGLLYKVLKHGDTYFKSHKTDIELIVNQLHKKVEIGFWLKSRVERIPMTAL